MSAVLPAAITALLDDLEPRAWFLAIEPDAEISPNGFTRCPFHPDPTGMLQLFADPGEGWWCWGCAQGGDLRRYLELRITFIRPVREAVRETQRERS